MMGQLGQVIEDMSIQTNVPALAMEEVMKSNVFLGNFNGVSFSLCIISI